MMAKKKHNWPQVWKSIGTITIASMLSVALFGLLYWALKLNTFQFELSVALGIIWIIATELLLSRFVSWLFPAKCFADTPTP